MVGPKPETDVRVYTYLDSKGIETLYAQTVDRLELEFRKSAEKDRESKIGARVSAGLKILLGIDVGTDISLSRKSIEETKYELTTLHKLDRICHYLGEDSSIHSDLVSAANECSKTGEIAYVEMTELFDIPSFYAGQDGVRTANESKAILFEINVPNIHVIMSASLANFTRIKNSAMSMVGHDAVMFREMEGRNVPLGVFGYMILLKQSRYQIKPFAIWIRSSRAAETVTKK